ncbi:CHAT domain-containing protein [candidate division KSB1 bacterium]|nr:CHAT domain-containing protein [candidate division KSB1 bacterium]
MRLLSRLQNKHLPYWLDGILILSILFLAFAHRSSLQDFEQRCRETPDPKEKEKIALAAVEFLVSQDVPDSIVNQVNQEVAKEDLSLPADTLLFPEIPAVMDDSLAGLYESRLAGNLPKLYWMRRNKPESVPSENFVAARKIAAELDAWANYAYWEPLMDFLEKADDQEWKRWRVAAKAADLSRIAYNQSHFERAKFFAISGFHSLVAIPDRRLYLDICFRLQNAIAEGLESLFNIGFALGDWITRESLVTRHYLRAVSTELNIGNQLMLTGRFDEALKRLKDVLRLIQRWRHVRWMNVYKDKCMERISAAAYNMGDYSLMVYYLNLSGLAATNTRQKTLYHIHRGQAAKNLGDFQTAETEFQEAITYGKGDERKGIEPDQLNVFYAYLNLGNLFLEYNLPEKAIFYYEQARAYGENIKGFFNPERMSRYWLRVAQAFIQKKDMTAAKMALENAKQFIDSPDLRVRHLFATATLYEILEQFDKAHEALAGARQICADYGIVLQEINAILRQATLALKAKKDLKLLEYPAEDLEKVIARVQKNGNKQQLINAMALVVEAASKAGEYTQAKHYADLLLYETEALSHLYDQEKRLIFFQHSIYENLKNAVKLDIQLGQSDSAFVKSDYIKARALNRRLGHSAMSNKVTKNLLYTNVTNLQKKLGSDEAIIDYIVTEDTLYTFALTRSELEIFRSAVTKRELQAEVDEYLNHLTANEQTAGDYNDQRLRQEFLKTVELSHILYNKLLEGVAGFLEKIDRFYIVPDEFLHALPFSTLVITDGIEPDFLINHKAIMNLSAASIFTKRMTRSETSNAPRILASIDPLMYDAPQIMDRMNTLGNKNSILRTGWLNGVEFKSSLANGYDLYFFYAHAQANWEDPWQSYIMFPLNQPRQYNKLDYDAIDSVDWQQAALVILAGCETTGSRIYSGAGLSGLQRSFLTGGTKQVLATLWKVDAAQVAFQMAEFLENWHHHGDTMLALQTMQQASITKLKKDPYLKYPHPRYWGAYNLTGTTAVSSVKQYAANSVN